MARYVRASQVYLTATQWDHSGVAMKDSGKGKPSQLVALRSVQLPTCGRSSPHLDHTWTRGQ